MINKCQCIACETKKYYEDVRRVDKKSCSSTTCKCKKVKNSPLVKNYRITLTDTGTTDGYSAQFSKEITIFDFVNLLSEHFGVDVSVDYDEEIDISVDETAKNVVSGLEFLKIADKWIKKNA